MSWDWQAWDTSPPGLYCWEVMGVTGSQDHGPCFPLIWIFYRGGRALGQGNAMVKNLNAKQRG